jgi:hypothetical protein
MADVDRQLDRLKIERERLGAVNHRAEEEQRELSERLVTIVSERGDVIEAIRKLRQAIQSLNREGRDRLLAAFEVVNGHFQRLFSHLFGGGTAELQLIESDDPLEAGLEILARPPGKKPQTMTLLSGGEQALTAMSLIFAVFLTNPAPICVLDEVDAPLDDHNVERFCNLMDEIPRKPASSSSPTIPSPWRAWTACSVSPWPSRASVSSSRSICRPPRPCARRADGYSPLPDRASLSRRSRAVELPRLPAGGPRSNVSNIVFFAIGVKLTGNRHRTGGCLGDCSDHPGRGSRDETLAAFKAALSEAVPQLHR